MKTLKLFGVIIILFCLYFLFNNKINSNFESSSNNRQNLPWGIEEVGFQKKGTKNPIKVAILDSGINRNHEDLENVVVGEYNALSPGNKIIDEYGHGTAIAGIIAANNNKLGIVGINSSAELYDVKLLNDKGRGSVEDLITGIEWCIEHKIDIINISFGFQSENLELKEVINKAISNNIIIVAAAGNTYGLITDYPAIYKNVISITSVDQNLDRSSFAASGKIDFAFPGEEILSTDKNGEYSLFEGTSFAAAHATGVLSVLLGKYQEKLSNQTFLEYVSSYLIYKEEWDEAKYGKGIINLNKEVEFFENKLYAS